MKKSLCLAALVLLAASIISATTVRPMSIEKLTGLADVVVEAHIIDSWSEWNAQHTRIYTFSRISITRALKGSQASTIVVKQPGGTKDGIKEVVFGVRHLVPGEDALLFLTPSSSNDGTLSVVGLMQGNFRIYKSASGEMKVSNGMPEVTVSEPGGKVGAFTGSRMTLKQIESHVRKAVAQ